MNENPNSFNYTDKQSVLGSINDYDYGLVGGLDGGTSVTTGKPQSFGGLHNALNGGEGNSGGGSGGGILPQDSSASTFSFANVAKTAKKKTWAGLG